MKKFPNSLPRKIRRRAALERLQLQVSLGTKNTKDGHIPLTERDLKRINKEILILQERI